MVTYVRQTTDNVHTYAFIRHKVIIKSELSLALSLALCVCVYQFSKTKQVNHMLSLVAGWLAADRRDAVDAVVV